MKTFKMIVLVGLLAIGLGCGYSKKMGAMPNIIQLTPASATAGTSVPLEVDGTNFASKAVINFNGLALTTTVVSSTKLEATVPASADMSTGMVPVTVTNPATSGGLYGGGTSAVTSGPMNFTIN
jgi:hypothetical protein